MKKRTARRMRTGRPPVEQRRAEEAKPGLEGLQGGLPPLGQGWSFPTKNREDEPSTTFVNISTGRGFGRGAHQSFVLSCQAFVTGQEHEEEAGHLGSSSPLFPSHSSSPFLSTYQRT